MLTAVAIMVGWLTLGALGLIVVGQALTGGINLHGLLHVKHRDGRRIGSRGAPVISAVRVQLLLATLATAATWLTSVWATRTSGTLPDIDARWLYGLGASHAVYLGRKAVQFLPMFDKQRQP